MCTHNKSRFYEEVLSDRLYYWIWVSHFKQVLPFPLLPLLKLIRLFFLCGLSDNVVTQILLSFWGLMSRDPKPLIHPVLSSSYIVGLKRILTKFKIRPPV